MLSRLVTCIILAVSFLPASALLRMSRDQVLDTLDRYLTEQSVYDARARQRVQAKVRRLSTLTGAARQQLQEDIISDYMHIRRLSPAPARACRGRRNRLCGTYAPAVYAPGGISHQGHAPHLAPRV